MKYHHPLKKILSQSRPYWDQDEMRPAVRRVFGKAMQCHTAELGAEVYSSENQELLLYHSCKSRACPSCGYRAHVQWLRERWAALPDALYKGITFTMPDLLWPLFRVPINSQTWPARDDPENTFPKKEPTSFDHKRLLHTQEHKTLIFLYIEDAILRDHLTDHVGEHPHWSGILGRVTAASQCVAAPSPQQDLPRTVRSSRW